MTGKFNITCDLFTIPINKNVSLLYAPRLGFVCKANQDLINLLSDLDSGKNGNINREQKETLELLEEKGVLNGSKELTIKKTFPDKYTPTQVTLFPTNMCNLRCIYCYASAGDRKPEIMDWFYATKAIDKIIVNLKKNNIKQFSLGFHGGGEPLFPWELIKKIVMYAEEQSAKENLKLSVSSATNGVLGEGQLEWIVKHFSSLNISFDGLPHVQDYHRPIPNGKGSFKFVDNTMRFLDDKNFNYSIRSTISSYNVELMEEIVDFICRNYKTNTIHFEPLFHCGRCKTDGDLKPDMGKFAKNYFKCDSHIKQYGVNLTYSGCKIESLTDSFCGVSCDNFSVTPDGFITTCYEVVSKDDPKAETFYIGRFGKDGRMRINEKKRKFLHSLSVDNLDYCQDCYAKWHCAGECVAKIGHMDYKGDRGHDRCELNRQIIKNRLLSLVEGKYPHLLRSKPENKNIKDNQQLVKEKHNGTKTE